MTNEFIIVTLKVKAKSYQKHYNMSDNWTYHELEESLMDDLNDLLSEKYNFSFELKGKHLTLHTTNEGGYND